MIHKIIKMKETISEVEICLSGTTGMRRTVLSYDTDNIAGGRSFSVSKKQQEVIVESWTPIFLIF